MGRVRRSSRNALAAIALALVLGGGTRSAAREFRNDLDPVMISAHAPIAGGLGSPYVFGRIGMRLEEKHVLIGLELSSLLQQGFAADALLYFVSVGKLRVHLVDPGVGWNAFGHYSSASYVKRSIDLRLGAGFELRLCAHGSATVDWKVSLPDPGLVITSYGDYGRAIFTDALKEWQLWLGVLFH
jgi:hypothetical protein